MVTPAQIKIEEEKVIVEDKQQEEIISLIGDLVVRGCESF